MLVYSIKEISDSNISSLEKLSEEALAENYNIVRKTIDDWMSKENYFSKPGEKLWGIFINNECIAIGGLNRDPYVEDERTGRVRHVYVAKAHRRKGLSKVLMKIIIDEARKNFKVLRLRTDNPIAAHLYESMGFEKKEGYKVTHILYLTK